MQLKQFGSGMLPSTQTRIDELGARAQRAPATVPAAQGARGCFALLGKMMRPQNPIRLEHLQGHFLTFTSPGFELCQIIIGPAPLTICLISIFTP